VYLGPHYAVDGYASMASVHVIWWLAGRRTVARRGPLRPGASVLALSPERRTES